MPQRKRPTIPPRDNRKPASKFVSSNEIPRRGWRDAIVWPDTGIFLLLGVEDDLPDRFMRLYKNRIRVPRKIEGELRGHTNGGTSRNDQLTAAAARASVNAMFLGETRFRQPELEEEDIPLVDDLRAALSKTPGGLGKAHGGEATLIALAVRMKKSSGKRQVLLSNDGGASAVAALHQIPTRHAADVLCEIACSDSTITAQRCWEIFSKTRDISCPPRACHPANSSTFECKISSGTCAPCDEVDPRQ